MRFMMRFTTCALAVLSWVMMCEGLPAIAPEISDPMIVSKTLDTALHLSKTESVSTSGVSKVTTDTPPYARQTLRNADCANNLWVSIPTPTATNPIGLSVHNIPTPIEPVHFRDTVTSPVYLPPSPLASSPVHGSTAGDTLDYQALFSPTMGVPHSKPTSSKTEKQSWLATVKSLFTNPGHTTSATAAAANDIPSDNIFVPIQPDNILPQIPIGNHHPVPRTGILDGGKPIHTNKFYANAFLGKQNEAIWTHPYSLFWGKDHEGEGVLKTWGMCVNHVEESEVAFGPGDPSSVYVNSLHKQSLILSATELGGDTVLTTDTHRAESVNVNLGVPGQAQAKMTFPVVLGMSFITAIYRDATPLIQTGNKGFVSFEGPWVVAYSMKYRVKGMEGYEWLIYITPDPNTGYDASKFTRLDANTIVGPAGFKGTIQVAKNPRGAETEVLYDRACGAYVTSATLTATVNDIKGQYALSYSKVGTSPLLMFALPHHIQSLDPELHGQVTSLQLRTTTKGMATAIWADKLSYTEPNLPTTMSFGPWIANSAARPRFPPDVLALIATVAEQDLRRVMAETIPPESLYYAGKSLAKFATIVWVLKEVLINDALAATGLAKLQAEFGTYVANQQKYPLQYDDTWKGVVSSAGFADPGADFGNTYYNDHHFHFGYFVYTAAVIGSLDPAWLAQGTNKAWTNMLVKDFAESDYAGREYPFSRSFDWWHGHSWAKGLFDAADGKDQESTSEDGFASYAVKMWGKVSGDGNMEKRGNLMLAIQARTFSNYFYLQSTNANHPARFIGNKVTGILFENKVDYATYFGNAPALIHGIHMLPISPASQLLRSRAFVQEEWAAKFSDGRANTDIIGWRAILYANLALVDPKASYAFFRDGVDGRWDDAWVDGGASRTWYLVFAAALSEGGKK